MFHTFPGLSDIRHLPHRVVCASSFSHRRLMRSPPVLFKLHGVPVHPSWERCIFRRMVDSELQLYVAKIDGG